MGLFLALGVSCGGGGSTVSPDESGEGIGDGEESVTLSGAVDSSADFNKSRQVGVGFSAHTLEGEDLVEGACGDDGSFEVSVARSTLAREDGASTEHVIFVFSNGFQLIAEVPVDEDSYVGIADPASTVAVADFSSLIDDFIVWGGGNDYSNEVTATESEEAGTDGGTATGTDTGATTEDEDEDEDGSASAVSIENLSGIYGVAGICDAGNQWTDTHRLDCTVEGDRQICTITESSQPDPATLVVTGFDCTITHPFNTVTDCSISGTGGMGTIIRTSLSGAPTPCREVYVKTAVLPSPEAQAGFSGRYDVTGRCDGGGSWSDTHDLACTGEASRQVCTITESSQPRPATIVITPPSCRIIHPFNTVTDCSVTGSGELGTIIRTTLDGGSVVCREIYVKTD